MSRLFLAGLILIGVLLGWQVVRSSSWQLNAVSQPQNTPQPRSTGFSVPVPIAASASAPAAVPQSRPNTTTPMPPSQIRPTTKPAFRPPIPAAW